jgi:hypothetical protein
MNMLYFIVGPVRDSWHEVHALEIHGIEPASMASVARCTNDAGKTAAAECGVGVSVDLAEEHRQRR